MSLNKNNLFYIFLAIFVYFIFTTSKQPSYQEYQKPLHNTDIISEIKQKNLDKYIPKTLTGDIITCNIGDLNCKAYNLRDINSVCDALCNPKIYTGNSTKKLNILSCECKDKSQIETFSSIDRDSIEDTQTKRQSQLIFGVKDENFI
jgi:hypothetical protein